MLIISRFLGEKKNRISLLLLTDFARNYNFVYKIFMLVNLKDLKHYKTCQNTHVHVYHSEYCFTLHILQHYK